MVNEISKEEASIFLASFFPQYKITDDPFERYLGYFDNDLLGIIAYSIIYERAEINYICVRPEHRRHNIGSKLMNNAVEKIEEANCDSISLEVKIDNIGAINLYKKFNFREVLKREKYYDGIDGVLMIRELGDYNG